MARLFILRSTPGDWSEERRCRALWARIATERGWLKFIDRRGVLAHYVCAPDEKVLMLRGGQGAIFGPLFSAARLGSPPITELNAAETSKLVEHGRGAILAGEYWGAYAAVLHDTGRDVLSVVRDPAGACRLFTGPLGSTTAIFSHAEDYLALADDAAPDFEFISAFVGHARLVTPQTAIERVSELLPGEELCIGRASSTVNRSMVWTPMPAGAFLGPDKFDEAAARLRDVVLGAAQSWAQVSPHMVHRLSGGLDSTIVLAALRRANLSEVTALNAYPDNVPEGDERPYARAAAEACGVSLLEVAMSPERIDYSRLLQCEFSAKPSRSSMGFTDDTVPRAILSAAPLALVTSGQGGDQIFHRLRTPLIAADAMRDGCNLGLVMEIALNTARLSRRPVWNVFSAVLEQGLIRRRQTVSAGLRGAGGFAGIGATERAKAMAADHPWSDLISRAPPARALRMSHIMDLQYYHQPNGLNTHFSTQPVLASQPIIEFVLRVPPYVMTWGGRERALARAAFADLVPEIILKRTGKGDTTRYHAAALARQLLFIREMLVGGELERAGLVDAAALRAALARDVVSEASMGVAISSALLAELWLRRFYELRRRRFDEPVVSGQGKLGDAEGEAAKRP